MSGASIFPRALKPEWLLPDTGSGEKKTRGCAHDTTPSSQPWGLTSLPPSPIPRFEPETFFFSSALQLPQPNPLHQSPPTQRVFLCCWKRKTMVPGSADSRQFTWASSQLKRGEKNFQRRFSLHSMLKKARHFSPSLILFGIRIHKSPKDRNWCFRLNSPRYQNCRRQKKKKNVFKTDKSCKKHFQATCRFLSK